MNARSPSDPIETPMDEWTNWGKPEFNNAAGRLIVVLKRMKNEHQNGSGHVGWRRCLFPEDRELPWNTQLDDDGWAKVTEALHGLYQAVKEVEAEIKEKHSEHVHIYLAELPTLKKIFTPDNFSNGFDSQRNLITDGLMANLNHCALAMEKEGPIDENDLRDVWHAAEEFADLIQSTDMPRALKTTLLDMVGKVQQALIHYRTFGAKGLKDALAALTGGVIIHKSQIDALPNEKAIKSSLQKVWTKLNDVATRADNILKLTTFGEKAIPAALQMLDYLQK